MNMSSLVATTVKTSTDEMEVSAYNTMKRKEWINKLNTTQLKSVP